MSNAPSTIENSISAAPASPRALIIGGSLAGLFAAITLRAIGWQVEVFERSPHELDSRGGGLVLQPQVLAAFEFAGIDFPRELGVASGDRIYLDREDRVVQRGYQPQTQTSWNMLYGAMKRSLPKDSVHAGEQLLRFEQQGGQVRAFFASGRVASGDLLIGADGPRSTVRRQVLPQIQPSYAGYVAWRGLAPESRLSQRARDRLQGVFAFQQGDGHMLLEYMVPGEDESTRAGERRWNWVWYRKVAEGAPLRELLTDRHGRVHHFSLPPGSARQDVTDALRQSARQLLAPTFQDLFDATDDIFAQAILDLQVPQMVFGRVVLLGDAAFVPRPHTAGGAAKAAANALNLAQYLTQARQTGDADIDTRLRGWQQRQLLEGYALTQSGKAMGEQIMGR